MIRAWLVCLVLLAVFAVAGQVEACWRHIDPQELARQSPVIVTGTIVRIEGPAPALGWFEDVARIRIEIVHKNRLKDVSVAPGGELFAGMASERSQKVISATLRYPIGTRAVWIILFDEDGRSRIDVHPGQCHPANQSAALGRLTEDEGLYTKAEWLARVERMQQWDARMAWWKQRLGSPYALFLSCGFAALIALLLGWTLRRRRARLLSFPPGLPLSPGKG